MDRFLAQIVNTYIPVESGVQVQSNEVAVFCFNALQGANSLLGLLIIYTQVISYAPPHSTQVYVLKQMISLQEGPTSHRYARIIGKKNINTPSQVIWKVIHKYLKKKWAQNRTLRNTTTNT
ncbi:hypothetical protein WA026_020603 [Henosepilachna vigintioctopunctata]|uniref:Uncharacterized protein n=1 Tax=Henosepilachna vigintioctopunctata TaxID=420089 RepID=A0AAW1UXH2_9CUCU